MEKGESMGYNRSSFPAVVALACIMTTVSACAGYSSNGGYNTDGSYDSDTGYGNSAKKKVENKVQSSDPRIVGPIAIVDTDIGPVIGGGKDKLTLYTFDEDDGIVSNCYDACATAWPPFIAENEEFATDSLGITDRKDGALQWTFEGKPLYFWAGDRSVGQTTGAGIPDWVVAKP